MCTCSQKTQELVALAQEGDQSALNHLYRIYAERVRWMVRFRMSKELRSKLESMDIVQDTLVHALHGLDGFTYKNEGDFVRWLSKIAENELRGSLRKLHADKRDIRKVVRLDDDRPTTGGGYAGMPAPVDATTPSVIMSRKEDLDKLEKAIDKLRPEYREVIVLTKIEGLSYKEISGRLGKSNDAVRKLASRAIVALTSVFESD
ncbi:MAG TPA: sigma-70 family RNA polymerase sigma factor [Sedimentisphaerales bacterium]|nr:sigma-70 family RNA polymerase sigma factor [Sedimentisphaerales bacterium]